MDNVTLADNLVMELDAADFLKIVQKKLDKVIIRTEEEILLLDKVNYKAATISKDYKMKLLTPELREKFNERMQAMKLDQTNFVNMLKPYINKPPYAKTGKTAENVKPQVQDNRSKAPSKPEPSSTLKSERGHSSYGDYKAPAKKEKVAAIKRKSSSSSSSSSDSDKEEVDDKINELQKQIAHLKEKAAIKSEPSPRPAKYSFTIKKPDGPRAVLPADEEYFDRGNRNHEPYSERGDYDHRPGSKEDYFDRGNRTREPRSERGDRDYNREREVDMYEQGQRKMHGNKGYYKPPMPSKW